ncbi:MAG: hypothetical protein KDC38_03985 [Planctomycetes bacterium]|nr:hypothetical protein [Planctomycetota bacterium]
MFLFALAAAAGCDGPHPQLVSALFVDGENPDGVVGSDESIVLTFSTPVTLREPVSSGVRLAPATHDLGFYLVRAVEPRDFTGLPDRLRDRQLLVVVQGGDRSVRTAGCYPDCPDASGVSVDFDRLGIETADGRRVHGLSNTVDLSQRDPGPASLVSAEWIDVDRSNSVNDGDELKLTWDRKVGIGEPVRRSHNEVPEDMLVLPVSGDRLDDGRVRTRLEQRAEERTLYAILGSSPRLSPAGVFDPDEFSVGDPTGLAVRGTSILRNHGIIDVFSRGVADASIVDLGGGLDLFVPIRVPRPFEQGVLTEHTATPLPGGLVLVTGGMIPTSGNVPQVLETAYFYDVNSGEWSAPLRMLSPRWGHTATYFAGPDGARGSIDDFVVIAGGWNQHRNPLRTCEVVFPFDDRPEFRPVHGLEGLSRRAHHTAHALEPWTPTGGGTHTTPCGHLVLVGGSDGAVLCGALELIDFTLYRGRTERGFEGFILEGRIHVVGSLAFPRIRHHSALVGLPEAPILFVYGGRGAEGENINALSWSCEALAAPELFAFEIHWADDSTPLWSVTRHRLPVDAIPGARVEPVLIPLREERANLLLVGGSEEESPIDDGELSTAYRIDIDLGRDPIVEYLRAGRMIAPRSQFASTLLPSGHALIVGGRTGGRPTNRVEVFDPASNEFEIYGSRLRQPRYEGTMTPLSEEEWLIVGGAPGGEVYRRPEW